MNRTERFEHLCAEFGPRLFGLVLRYVKNRVVAEDLWQDVLWSAWRSFSMLDPDRDPLPWMRTLVINRVIDHVRQQGVRATLRSADEPPDTAAAQPPDGLELADDLAALPIHERAALLLHYLEGRSVAEIAVQLAVPEGTIKTWLFRGRARLRSRVAKEIS